MNPSALSAAVLQRGGVIPTICACCGELFHAKTMQAAYCGTNCRVRAYYYRRSGRPVPPKGSVVGRTQPIRPQQTQPEILPATPAMPALEVREWNGTPIQRRPADGYVNATAMCKANGKHLPHYLANKGTDEYLQALSPVVGIPTTDLVQSIQGGIPSLQGTWVHVRVAVYLARLINPPFAVWMDGWFLESMASQLSTVQPQPVPIPSLLSPITAERVQSVLTTCDPLTVNAILNTLGLPCSRSNQVAASGIMQGLGYRLTQATAGNCRIWARRTAAPQPPALPSTGPAILIRAKTDREAAQLWCDAVEATTLGAIRRKLSTTHRDDSAIPYSSHWQRVAA